MRSCTRGFVALLNIEPSESTKCLASDFSWGIISKKSQEFLSLHSRTFRKITVCLVHGAVKAHNAVYPADRQHRPMHLTRRLRATVEEASLCKDKHRDAARLWLRSRACSELFGFGCLRGTTWPWPGSPACTGISGFRSQRCAVWAWLASVSCRGKARVRRGGGRV